MEQISNSIIEVEEVELITQKIGLKEKVKLMIAQDRISEAFFMTRRLAAEGDTEAKILAEEIFLPYIIVSPTWACLEKLSTGSGVFVFQFVSLPNPTTVGLGSPMKT